MRARIAEPEFRTRNGYVKVWFRANGPRDSTFCIPAGSWDHAQEIAACDVKLSHFVRFEWVSEWPDKWQHERLP